MTGQEKTIQLTDEEIDYIISELEFGGPCNDKERELEESIRAKLDAAKAAQ